MKQTAEDKCYQKLASDIDMLQATWIELNMKEATGLDLLQKLKIMAIAGENIATICRALESYEYKKKLTSDVSIANYMGFRLAGAQIEESLTE